MQNLKFITKSGISLKIINQYEEVYILGESDKPFRDCMSKYGRARDFHDHAEEFGATKIISKTKI